MKDDDYFWIPPYEGVGADRATAGELYFLPRRLDSVLVYRKGNRQLQRLKPVLHAPEGTTYASLRISVPGMR